MSVVDTLAEIIRNQHLLLSKDSNNPLFHGALVHQIFMLSEPVDLGASPAANAHLQRGAMQVSVCTQSLWGILYQHKKPLLDEIFQRNVDPDLYSARAACGEVANRYWLKFVDTEAAGSTSTPVVQSASLTQSARQVGGQIQQQIQSRLSRVARSGLKRLTSRTGLGGSLDTPERGIIPVRFQYERPKFEQETLWMWIRIHVSLLQEMLRSQSQRYGEWHAHVRKWTLDEWRQTERELVRERAIWGPEVGSTLDKYTLDVTEGSCRVRKKTLLDADFFARYPYRPALDAPEAKAQRAKVAISRDARVYFERMQRRRARTMDKRIVDRAATPGTAISSTTASSGGGEESTKSGGIFDPTAELNLSLIKSLAIKQAAAATASLKQANDDEVEDAERKEMSADEHEAEDEEASEEETATSPTASTEALATETTSTTNEKLKAATQIEPDGETRDFRPQKQPSDALSNVKSRSLNTEPDYQTLLRLLETGEHLHSMFRCARVQGLDTIEGLLLFGRQHFYVVDGYTLLKTKEIRDLDFLPEQYHDPIVPYMASGSASRQSTRGVTRQCAKFSYDDIREAHKRRYLLQPIALEVFSDDGRNYLLAFPRRIRDRVLQKILAMSKHCAVESAKLDAEQKRLTATGESTTSAFFGSILQLGAQTMVQKWQSGAVSNFEYLMFLNTMAGRTNNDLSQYIIFPWILKDYESDSLDLTSPHTFRNLAKPMGAQTPERLAQFLKRYVEWDDPSGETPPYMYGTHYSSAMIVLSYLVRLEPFTQQFLKLQGGHFDLADRLFHSIRDAWMSASKNNMADVKELTAEWFYLPEIFVNANNFDLGVKQSGVQLHDVVLPTWAHGDPREFIRIHRQALECDYVSEHLSDWIDLIFGYKQSGEAARATNNVFHHLFYEANVDLERISDPLTRNATVGFINNFGQIPSQLFKRPHPQKKVPTVGASGSSMGGAGERSSVSSLSGSTATTTNSDGPLLIQPVPGVTTPRLFYHALETLRPSKRPVKELRAAVGDITVNDRNQVIVLEQNKVLVPPNAFVAWGFHDRSVRMGMVGSDKSTCIAETNVVAEITCMACADSRLLFAGLSTGNIIVYTLESARTRRASARPAAATSSGAASSAPMSTLAAVATGATAGSVSGVMTSNSDGGISASTTSSSRQTPTLRTKRVLAAHTDGVTALAVCVAHNFIVSASRDHTAIVWHLTQLTYIRQLRGHTAAVSAVATNEASGDIATASGSLLGVWTLNGEILAQVNTAEAGLYTNTASLILCLAFSTANNWDDHNVVMCGTKDGLVKIYTIDFKQTAASTADDKNAADSDATTIGADPKALKEHFLRRQKRIYSNTNRLSSRDVSDDSQASSPTASSGRSGGGSQTVDPTSDDPRTSAVTSQSSMAWRRVCTLRRVLCEHTTHDTSNNLRPAPITVIACSRDHRKLFVGDGAGRVWMWGMDSRSGDSQDTNNQSNESGGEARCCVDCSRPFAGTAKKAVGAQSGGVARLRVVCKNCGASACEKCISEEMNTRVSQRRIQICRGCAAQLKEKRKSRDSAH